MHTFKASWDWEGSITTGAGHWVAAPVGFVQAVESNVLSVENSVGFQVCDPELLGIIEDAASFDSNCAGSWKRTRENNEEQLRHIFTTCCKSTQTCSPQYWAGMPAAAPAEGQPFPCFSPPTPADWLGRPVSCVLALYFSIALKNVVIQAAVFNLLLIAVLSHHSKGDEAVGDPCWDGAAHL